MNTIIILISEAGHSTAMAISRATGGEVFSLHNEHDTTHVESIKALLDERWTTAGAFVFVGAMGICVRAIAPYLRDKHTDPAVVCTDCAGTTVIPVLSGHVGGANSLATDIAAGLGARAAITTQSDVKGLWALDTLDRRFGWTVMPGSMNRQIALFAGEKPTALLLTVRDRGTDWMEDNKPGHVEVFYRMEDIDQSRFDLLIVVGPRLPEGIAIPCLHYVVRCLRLGIGLARQAGPAATIVDEMFGALGRQGIPAEAVASLATVEEKAGEPVVALLRERGYEVALFAAADLRGIDVPTPSDTVMRYMGTPSVSEAAAILASGHGQLVVPKTKGPKGDGGALWTMAAAIDSDRARGGHVEFIGAGPGDPDLVSVRGRGILERADLILYAGSLVPRALTACAKRGATVVSSASMALEEQVELMRQFYNRGLLVARLHTGDPCLYGAIQEQMNIMDRYGMCYHITPGISAFQAAAAELRSQFTIPRRTQTIILTRGEGRTPMPDREKLHLLARSRSTMCIYLSADIVENVQEELMKEYPATTPVAVCYKLTWPEQKIFRGRLKDLAALVRDNGLRLDTLLVVGEAIDNRHGLSELYSKHFSHLYRKSDDGAATDDAGRDMSNQKAEP